MPNFHIPLSLFLLIILVVSGGYYLMSSNRKNSDSIATNLNLSPSPTESPLLNSEQVVDQQVGIFSPSPKPSSSPASPTPSPTDKSTSQNSNLSDFIYPNSKQVLSSGNGLTLESSDNTDSITNWYKEKIRSLGMNAKSFVTTKTNDKVLNKLAGADGSKEVNVEISKEPGSTVAKIIVKVS